MRRTADFSLTLHCHRLGGPAAQALPWLPSQPARSADVSSVLEPADSGALQSARAGGPSARPLSPGEAWEDLHRAALGWTLISPLPIGPETGPDGRPVRGTRVPRATDAPSEWAALPQRLDAAQESLPVAPLPREKAEQAGLDELIHQGSIILRADRELIRCVERMSAGGRGGAGAMLTACASHDAEGGLPELAWGDGDKYRFRGEEGGEGGTPLMQCILVGESCPAALLAARYMLYRYPDLVLDAYGEQWGWGVGGG